MRITRKAVEAQFVHVFGTRGLPTGLRITDTPPKGYTLNHYAAAAPNVWKIQQRTSPDHFGDSEPFGSNRWTHKEMAAWLMGFAHGFDLAKPKLPAFVFTEIPPKRPTHHPDETIKVWAIEGGKLVHVASVRRDYRSPIQAAVETLIKHGYLPEDAPNNAWTLEKDGICILTQI